MKALITGANGFVGRYLEKELYSHEYEVICTDHTEQKDMLQMNILDTDDILYVIDKTQPDLIYHLAGQSSVSKSWDNPGDTFLLNVIGTINLLEVVRKLNRKIRVILIGSSDQYGILESGVNRVDEGKLQNPVTPYAISKRTQEDIGLLYCRHYEVDICMTRSFNHIGVGQSLGFVIPDLAHGIALIENGNESNLKVGNLKSARDFTDVKDIVRAYRLIGERGISGSIYNVGSGELVSVEHILKILMEMATVEVHYEQDPKRIRKVDTPSLVCNSTKLKKDTGWEKRIPIENTIRDVLDFYRNMVSEDIG